MRYRLRTLLIVLALGPPVLAGAWLAYPKAVERYRQWQLDRLLQQIAATLKPNSSGLGEP